MEGLQFKIDKLEGKSDWMVWKYKITILLRSVPGAIDVLEGKLIKPEEPAGAACQQDIDLYNSKFLHFSRADSNALLVITTHLTNENLEKVIRHTSAFEVWQELHRLFDSPDEDKIYNLLLEFFQCTKDNSADLASHVSRLKNMWDSINREYAKMNINCTCGLPSILLVCKILGTLPSEYITFRTSWLLMNKTERTVDNLTSQLCSFERVLSSEYSSCSEALFSKAQLSKNTSCESVPSKGRSEPSKGIRCHYCGIVGHVVRRCPKWLADGKPPRHQGPMATDNAGASMALMEVKPFILSVNNDQNDDKYSWYVDNGATHHVTNQRNIFKTFEHFNVPQSIRTANGDCVSAAGKGTVHIEAKVRGQWEKIILSDVWYVPGLCKNLFSVLAAQDKNLNSQFTSTTELCIFKINGKVRLLGYRKQYGGLFKLMVRTCADEVNVACQDNLLQLYHERLGHQNKKHVRDIIARELGISVDLDRRLCEGCVYGKAHRLKFGERPRAKEPGELIHSDVCGPFRYSLGNHRYFVLFKDDFSRYRSVYFMKNKSEVPEKLKQFLNESKALGNTIKELLSDNGGEFDSNVIRGILCDHGVRQRLTMPYTPQQNGCSERENRTIVETARAMMHAHDEIPQGLWAEMISTAAYILNRSGVSGVENVCPYELWMKKKPNLKHLKIIGCTCYAHIPKPKRKKMDKKAIKGVLIGYDNDDGYRIWLKENNQLIRSRDVIFEEIPLIPKIVEGKGSGDAKYNLKLTYKKKEEDRIEDERRINSECESNEDYETTEELDEEGREETNQGHQMVLRDRSRIMVPRRFQDYVLQLSEPNLDEPETYQEAVSSIDRENWMQAMNSEMCSLQDNNTWTIQELPPGKRAIPCKWIYKLKMNPDGTVERYKARLVVKGYSQRKGTDYGQTFSPVAKAGTIRALLSVAANEGLKLRQFDVSTAFLYGELEEEIFMNQPEGYNDGTGRVCRLLRSLYGLKQAPRCWNKRFGTFLLNLGFVKSDADPCLFTKIDGDKKICIALYVDDGLVAASDDDLLSGFLFQLKSAFKITEKPASFFLGLEIDQRLDGSIKLKQESYTNKVLERFGWDNCKPTPTPILKDSKRPGKVESETDPSSTQEFPYRQAVGALMYLMTGTRPDIGYAVSVVSRTLENPTREDWIKVTRIFRYLKGTKNMGIVYRRGFREGVLEGYSDADLGGDEITGRSTSGVICTYSGGAISWLSQRQPSVAISTTEAEVVAASEAARELSWLKRLLSGITVLKTIPELQIDNEAATRLAQNPEYHRRTKHIKTRHFFVREMVSEGLLDVKKVPTEFQVADIMTKPLHNPRHVGLCRKMGLHAE